MEAKRIGVANLSARTYARLYRRKRFFWAGAIRYRLASNVATVVGSLFLFMNPTPFMKPAAVAMFALGVAQVYGTVRYDIPQVRMRYQIWAKRRQRMRRS